MIEISERQGRVICGERRLDGVSLMNAIDDADGPERDQLVEAYLDTAARLEDLPLTHRGWFGQLIGPGPVRATTWSGFLRDHAVAGLKAAGLDELADPDELALALPGCDQARVGHLDAIPGNMLVVDGGSERRHRLQRDKPCRGQAARFAFNCGLPRSAGHHPDSQSSDVEAATSWLETTGLTEHLEPARPWLAAFWSFAVDDHALHRWCRPVLAER